MKVRMVSVVAVASVVTALVAPMAWAQQAPPPPSTEVGASLLALANLPARNGATLTVTNPAFTTGGDIPFENTSYRGNVFPGLKWSAGPAGTKSYAVIMQDGDAMSHGAPILHWTMVNIPANTTQLDAAMSQPPAGAEYGPNIRGPAHAYMGPHTPPGPKHRYHLQVFALDNTIPAAALADYAGLTAAMKGHVLASGEVIGLGQAPPTAAP
jgi:para-nitrobenzyl esterase